MTMPSADGVGNDLACRVADCALRAMLYEACVSPKPGLVDRFNSGAHRDMDIFTFMDSSCALRVYFRDVTLLGQTHAATPPENLLPHLRRTGVLAENVMMAATGGVNTHKGLIFSLGIICAALGQAYVADEAPSVNTLLGRSAHIAAPALDELTRLSPAGASTRGEALNLRYGVTGIRGEAAAGFPSVRRWGLPVLKRYLSGGASINDAGVAVLLNMMANVADTNMIGRSGMAAFKGLQSELGARIRDDALTIGQIVAIASELDKLLSASNISPGGCADLLAITLALHFMEKDELIKCKM